MTRIAIGSSDSGAGRSSASGRTNFSKRWKRLADGEGRAGVDRAAGLRDAGGDGVAALAHAARAAEVQADQLAGERGDGARVAVAAGWTGDRVRRSDRVDRVAEIADREDHDARAD